MTKTHEANAYVCDAKIVAGLDAAMAAVGEPKFHLPSGAGHDAMMIGEVAPAGMLFVRCKAGISHSPLELISLEDCEAGLNVLMQFLCQCVPPRLSPRRIVSLRLVALTLGADLSAGLPVGVSV